jgi:hypothetical protein
MGWGLPDPGFRPPAIAGHTVGGPAPALWPTACRGKAINISPDLSNPARPRSPDDLLARHLPIACDIWSLVEH